MGSGRRFYRTGLLVMKKAIILLAVFLLIIPQITADDFELQVHIEVEPDVNALIYGSLFTITFIIEYSSPNNIEVTPPEDYEDFLRLDRVIKYARVTGPIVSTIVEFRFIPSRVGRFTLEPFIIECPEGIIETIELALNIRSAGQRLFTPRLRWEGVTQQQQITAGERITLILRADGWNAQQPPPSFFMPEVPQKVILTSLPVSPDEREAGVVIKLLLIPLEAGNFILPARVLQQENVRFEIPVLRLQVISRQSAVN